MHIFGESVHNVLFSEKNESYPELFLVCLLGSADTAAIQAKLAKDALHQNKIFRMELPYQSLGEGFQ